MRRTGSKRYKRWRESVFKRDKFCCKKCRVPKALNAHHIDGWAFAPKKRYWVSNGITLCARCHYLFHENFMGGSKVRATKSKLESFMSSFDILDDHPIDPVVFSRYIGS